MLYKLRDISLWLQPWFRGAGSRNEQIHLETRNIL
jgi:hypothetical protein